MALFYVPDIADRWELSEEEAAHCLRVLRLSVGDALDITDGRGTLYKAQIASIAGKHCYVEAKETINMPKNWRGNIHIAIAPTKNMDRIEWLAEKATEIGLDAITFLNCRFSERKVIKTERVERIVVSAMKQSLKYSKPVVGEMVDFGGLLGYAPIIPVNQFGCDEFVNRRGRIPASAHDRGHGRHKSSGPATVQAKRD